MSTMPYSIGNLGNPHQYIYIGTMYINNLILTYVKYFSTLYATLSATSSPNIYSWRYYCNTYSYIIQ